MSIKIDLGRLIKYVLKRIWLPILLAVILAGGMFYRSAYMTQDTYTASATMYVYNANPNLVNYQYINSSDLNTAVQLMDTYMAVIRSNKVMDAVCERLDNPEILPAQVASTLSMGSVSGTGLLRISSTTRDPQLSMDICNAVASIAPSEIIRVVGAGSMEVVDYAELPMGPNGRGTLRNMTLGLLAGGVLGCGILVLLFLLNQRVADSRDLTDRYTLPMLGIIPRQSRSEGFVDRPISKMSPASLLVAYGKLRMNLNFTMKNKHKLLLVSSSVPGEGKSTVAANVAVSFAMDNKRVLLVDGDMRKPRQHQMFALNQSNTGLSDMLIGESSVKQVTVREIVPNLDLIPAGAVPPNPAELLNSSEMRKFLKNAEENYDYVVLDTPPINVVSDPLVLSDENAGLLFVTRAGYSDHREIRKALVAAEFTNIPVLGMVMTCANERAEDGYYRRGYKRYYNAYDQERKRAKEVQK